MDERDAIIQELTALHLRRKRIQQGWCSHPATESLEIETKLFSLASRAWLLTKDKE